MLKKKKTARFFFLPDFIKYYCVLRNMLVPYKHDQEFHTQRTGAFFTTGKTSGIQATHAKKLRLQLGALNAAVGINDMDKPGWYLHPLAGDHKELWSIKVNKNWRVVFKFEEGNAYIVNYEDYH